MIATNELRVFVSSTFRDLQEEREHLVKKIFPEIRALCRARGITFTEVDLRWGLTDENVVLGQVIGTCLAEIDRCRPYFIGITGERYGYVPALLEYYKDPELLRAYPWIEEAAIEGASIIDLEFRHAVLNDVALDDALRSDVVPGDVAAGSDAVNDVVVNDAAGNDRVVTASRASSRDTSHFFFRRQRRGVESAVDDTERERLESLKARVRDCGFVTEEFRDPASLGEAVYDALMEIIDRDFVAAVAPSALDLERASHRAFAESRRHAYIPNPEYLKRLNEWFDECDRILETPLVIYAESGSGKSSLVSFWCQQMRRRYPTLPIIEHYVGIGAGASDHLAIMRHIMDEVRELFGRTEDLPSKPEELEQQFANWLGFSVGKPVLIVIDGINQLTGRALDLTWLPPVMPPGVRLIITSTIEKTLVDLRARDWSTLGMQPLSEQEREAVVVRFLAEYHKALSPEQVRRIAADIKCSHPLFLRTLLEELRLEAKHETLEGELDRYLSATGTEDLFQLVLERMEEDFGARAIRSVMSLLWCSRAGLDETDLQSLTGVSRLKLSTILGGLDYHLVRKEGVLTFFHDYLRRAVEKRYMSHEHSFDEHWKKLAAYFEHAPLTLRSTRELLNALEMLDESERLLATTAEIERFELLWPGEGRYEVLRHWAGIDREQIGSTLIEALAAWRGYDQPSPDRLAAVLEHLDELLQSVGCWAEAESVARERIHIARALNDRLGEARALSLLSRILSDRGHASEAAQTAGEAESIARSLGDRSSIAAALHSRAGVHKNRGEYDEALACCEEQESIARELGDRQSLSMAVGNCGTVHYILGENDKALARFAEQESIARELGDRKSVARSVGNRGVAYAARGEYDKALDCYAEQESIARGLGYRHTVAHAVGNRGNVHVARGEFDEAIECYAEKESIARELGDQTAVSQSLGNRGCAFLDKGEFDKGLECLGAAVQVIATLGNRWDCAFILAAACNALLRKPELALADFPWSAFAESTDAPAGMDTNQLALVRARRLAESACRIADEFHQADVLTHASILLARIDHLEGRYEQSCNALQKLMAESTDAARTATCHFWLWALELEPAVDHRAEAEQLYVELIARNPKHEYKNRLASLRSVTGKSQIASHASSPRSSH